MKPNTYPKNWRTSSYAKKSKNCFLGGLLFAIVLGVVAGPIFGIILV